MRKSSVLQKVCHNIWHKIQRQYFCNYRKNVGHLRLNSKKILLVASLDRNHLKIVFGPTLNRPNGHKKPISEDSWCENCNFEEKGNAARLLRLRVLQHASPFPLLTILAANHLCMMDRWGTMAGFPTALKSQSLHPYLFNVRTSEKWVKDCKNGFAANKHL